MGASESTQFKVRPSSGGHTPTASPSPRPKTIKFDSPSHRKEAVTDSPKTVRSDSSNRSHRAGEKQVTFSDRIEKKKSLHLRQVSLPEKPRSPVLKSSLKNISSYSTPASPVDERSFLFSGNDASEQNACCEVRDSSRRRAVYVASMDVSPEWDSSMGRPGDSGRVFLVSDNTCVFTRNKKQVPPRPVSASGPSTSQFEFTAVKHVPVYVSSVDSLCYKKRDKKTNEMETQTEESLDVRQRHKRTESPLSRSRRSSGYASANGSPTVSRIELPDNVFSESVARSIEGKELGSVVEVGLQKLVDAVSAPCLELEKMAPKANQEEDTPATEQVLVEAANEHSEDQSKTRKSFRGFLRIQLNLTRPISVVAGTTPPSLYDLLQADDATSMVGKELTSFFLPRGAFKSVHVTSETTTGQLIVVLLRKFHVVDDPRKFALYEKYAENGDTTKVHLRRMDLDEKPLHIVMKWEPQERLGVVADGKADLMNHIPTFVNRSFVLQENETGDINWDAFAVPELQTFLRILDREEGEYRNQIVQKYKNLRAQIRIVAEGKLSGNAENLPQISVPKPTCSSSSDSEDDEYMTMKRNKTLPLMQKYDKDRFADANDSDNECEATLKPSSNKRF